MFELRIPQILVVMLGLVLAGCGGDPGSQQAAQPADTAPAPVADAPSPPEDPELAAMIADADLKRGKVQYFQCRACHGLKPEAEPGKIGPTLYDVVGRRAGGVPGYKYSDAVASSGITWTVEQIDKWLERPSEFLPGNKMVFVGVKKRQDRANIIAYIQAETAKVDAQ